jgi:hypothetical protein
MRRNCGGRVDAKSSGTALPTIQKQRADLLQNKRSEGVIGFSRLMPVES